MEDDIYENDIFTMQNAAQARVSRVYIKWNSILNSHETRVEYTYDEENFLDVHMDLFIADVQVN